MRAQSLQNNQLRAIDAGVRACQPRDVLIAAQYSGVNRADLLQTLDKYPVPVHADAIPGLEVAGEVIACGAEVHGITVGEHVCALVTEGAYAEQVIAPVETVLPVRGMLGTKEAATFPEAVFTTWLSLVWQLKLARGETILIHGGASGIGTMAIQVARFLGANVIATVSTPEKAEACKNLGAEETILYNDEDFVARSREFTKGRGVDAILDMVGGDYVARNMQALAENGRISIIAFPHGATATLDLSVMLRKRLHLMGSMLRPRPLREKRQLRDEIATTLWPEIEKGNIKPLIDSVFPLEEAEKALKRMERGLNIGKILLKV